jgi:hypothetical protein
VKALTSACGAKIRANRVVPLRINPPMKRWRGGFMASRAPSCGAAGVNRRQAGVPRHGLFQIARDPHQERLEDYSLSHKKTEKET